MKSSYPGGTCFLSPHSDDTCMSAFFIIKNNVLPKPYFLFTVFGSSFYVDSSKENLYNKNEITGIRLNEDRVFAEKMGLTFLFNEEPDCLKRYGEVTFNSAYKIDYAYLQKIIKIVYSQIKDENIKTLIVQNPSGARQHLDHRILKEAAIFLARQYNYNILFLDDIPYSTTDGKNIEELIYISRSTRAEMQDKHLTMGIYTSQMCQYFHDSIDKFSHERLFRIAY